MGQNGGIIDEIGSLFSQKKVNGHAKKIRGRVENDLKMFEINAKRRDLLIPEPRIQFHKVKCGTAFL